MVTILHRWVNIRLSTQLHKIRGHKNIKGDDLGDTAAKLVVIIFEGIPERQKCSFAIGKQAERPFFWVMHTHHSTSLGRHRSTPSNTTPARWTIHEEERRCMHVFSNQLRLKCRNATLRSFYTISLYIYASFSKQKPKGPAEPQSAPQSTPTSVNP
jgi:hypothetical protein